MADGGESGDSESVEDIPQAPNVVLTADSSEEGLSGEEPAGRESLDENEETDDWESVECDIQLCEKDEESDNKENPYDFRENN